MELAWTLSTFEQLSSEELYTILALRQRVFVVEQHCVYQDCDGRDRRAHHLAGWHHGGKRPDLIAYLRILYPDNGGTWPSIGRVVTHPDYRRRGVGREIVTRGLHHIDNLYPGSPVRISAQLYLVDFYNSFGFNVNSDPYDEDGISHIEMVRPCAGR